LWHACRSAKEELLSENPPETHPVTILGRGSKLIGGTVSVDLESSAVSSLLLDGFFRSAVQTALHHGVLHQVFVNWDFRLNPTPVSPVIWLIFSVHMVRMVTL
jgi:hypothetical protein